MDGERCAGERTGGWGQGIMGVQPPRVPFPRREEAVDGERCAGSLGAESRAENGIRAFPSPHAGGIERRPDFPGRKRRGGHGRHRG